MSLLAGTRLRDYQIQSLIGKGGMGEVYLAEELTLGRKVAIKVLKQEAIADPLFLERFRNEARVLGQLNHPNIVGLYSFFEDSGSYYLVMQYAPGITLSELIRRIGPIPEQRAMRIFAQIGEALAYAHSENVVHRDIKPSNIMIDSEKNDRALVMDFGIARLMTAQHITRTGTQMGTPCYMSPEQVLGEKEITNRSDIYSAGVVLYEMLSGSIPYDLETESLYKVQNRIVQEALPDPRKCYEYISEANVRLIEALTNKDPDARPESIINAMQKKITTKAAEAAQQVISNPVPKYQAVQNTVPIKQEPIPANDIKTGTKPSGQLPGEIHQRREALNSRPRWIAVGVLIFFVVLYGLFLLANGSKKVVSVEPMIEEPAPAVAETEKILHDEQFKNSDPIKEAKPSQQMDTSATTKPADSHNNASIEAYKVNSQALMEDVYQYYQSLYEFWKAPVSQGGAGQFLENVTPTNISNWLSIGLEPYQEFTKNGTIWFSPPVFSDPSSCYCVISGIGNVARNGKVPRQDAKVYLPGGGATITPSSASPR